MKGYKRAKENYKGVNRIMKTAPNIKIIFYTGNCRYLELRQYKRMILIIMEIKSI